MASYQRRILSVALRARGPIAVGLIGVGLVAVAGSPAVASCVSNPSQSAFAFNGTVVSTEANGRIARVATEDGRTVEVRGTKEANGFTPVDRTFRVGAQYEFHPVNNASPYEDNACTATRERTVATRAAESVETEPAAGENGDQSAPGLLIFAGLLAVALAAGGMFTVATIRRRRAAHQRP